MTVVTVNRGVRGRPGPPGSGLVSRGAWSNVSGYDVPDWVTHDNSAWVAAGPSLNIEPGTDPAKWLPLATGVEGPPGDDGTNGTDGQDGLPGVDGLDGHGFTPRGIWTTTTAYAVDDVVQYAPSGKVQTYRVLTAHLSGGSFNASKFELWAQAGADGVGGGGGDTFDHSTLQPKDDDLTVIAALDSATAGVMASDGAGWIRKTFAQLKTSLGLMKGDVGLGNVDNTSDANKPVSTAQQTAFDLKQNEDADLTTIANLTPSNDDVLQRKAGSWINRTIAQLKNDLGLGNVDNTSDVNKPVSTATQDALNLKADSIAMTTALGDKADLVGGFVPAGQLPSYVDDVLEYANLAAFPATGVSGKIYVALDTNITFRWSGSAYAIISDTIALGETSATAYRGDRGKTAYDHSQDATTNPHNVTKAQVGLGNVDNTSDTNKPVSTAQQTALDNRVSISLVDAKGDLFFGSADNVVARLPVGSDSQVLTADSSQAVGAKWATPSSGSLPSVIYGDGSDGAFVFNGSTAYSSYATGPTSNVYTLTRDIFATSITVNSGVTIVTAGFRLFCTGTFTNNGTIHANGGNASGTNQSVAGVIPYNNGSTLLAGTGLPGAGGGTTVGAAGGGTANLGLGGNGGASGLGVSGAGAAGGINTINGYAYGWRALPGIMSMTLTRAAGFLALLGGAGGGGGGGDGTNKGGAGGAGGGTVLGLAKTFAGTGTFSANGGSGGSPTTGNCGGGGGGGGGVVILISPNAISGLTVQANGGGSGTAVGTGVNGSAGSAGQTITMVG